MNPPTPPSFSAPLVQEFEGGFGTFLVADYSIDVNGSAYQRMTPFAVIMIFVWPVGVPLFITVLLWRNRRTLLEARRREKIIGTYDGYNNGTWFDHLAKVEAMGGTCDQRDKEELEIGGYLFSLTLNNYRARVFYWEVIPAPTSSPLPPHPHLIPNPQSHTHTLAPTLAHGHVGTVLPSPIS